jgi:hypothetical protein
MAETTKPDLTYVCPNCGQHAIIGTHFCRTSERDSGPEREPRRRQGSGNNGFFGMIGALMVLILLWRWLGPASLLIAGVGLLLFFGWGWRRDADFKALVKLCSDEETARQLIAEEQRENPRLSRSQAIRAALMRRMGDK